MWSNHFRRLSALTVVMVFTGMTVLGALHLRAQETAEEGRVRVGRMVYANDKTSKCFAEGFLELADRHVESPIQRTMDAVKLSEQKLFDYPFIIMTGEGGYELSQKEKDNLKAYLDRGGFLLASAGCSNQQWADSFRKLMKEIYPESALKEIDTDHPMLHTLYDIDAIVAKKRNERGALYALMIDDRAACVFSPLGLNDTGNAGKGCCCCGGNEVKNAKEINANILLYALTH